MRYQFVDCRWKLGEPGRGPELYLAGHIPGARNAPWNEALPEIPPGEVVAYCGSGITAAVLVHRLALAGRDAKLYPGSWSEWSGLGYNRRARDLHRIARMGSALPRTVAALDALPGIGAYTASAVACFALDQATGFADTNIRRVLGRAILGRLASDGEAVELDVRLGSKRKAARWHHALMDIGATICLAKRPRCDVCPVRTVCKYDGVDGPAKRRQSPFAGSDRRVRGAIVRQLAMSTRGLKVDALRRGIKDGRVPRLVRLLESEGLVEVSSGSVRLPAR